MAHSRRAALILGSPKELDAASIAQLLLTTTTISPIIYGLSCALDSGSAQLPKKVRQLADLDDLKALANQAVHSDNPKNTSLYVQRTGLLQAICMIPAGITLFFAERIFLAIGQDAEIARLAGEYIRVYMISLPFLAAFELMRRWLLAQGKVNVPTYALLVAAPSSLVLNWLLVLSECVTGLPSCSRVACQQAKSYIFTTALASG